MAKQFLNEIFYTESESLNESVYKDEKTNIITIRDIILQRADEPNRNKRVYPRHIIEREISKLLPEAQARRLRGELDHPENRLTTLLENVSHMVTTMRWDGNICRGDIEILKTPKGLIAEVLINQRSPFGVSSRAEGSLQKGQDGYDYVQNDLEMITFDLVNNESTIGAIVNESLERNPHLREQAYQNIKKLYWEDYQRNINKLYEQIDRILK